MLQLIFNTDFFFSILRITAPILFATLGAVVGEKAGVSNIGLEGTMMVAALFGSLTTYWSGSWAVGLIVALFCGVLVILGVVVDPTVEGMSDSARAMQYDEPPENCKKCDKAEA